MLFLHLILHFTQISVAQTSDSWIISSYTVLPETAQFVQLHPTMNGIAYGVRRTVGLDSINITNVNAIQVVYTTHIPLLAYWRIHCSKVNNRLYVAAMGGGLIMCDITTDPWRPSVINKNLDLSSSYPSTITQMTSDNNYVYAVGVKSKAFLAILSHDLSTIYGTWEESTSPGSTALQSVYVIDNNTLIAGDGESLLRIFDMSDLNNITVIGTVSTDAGNTWIYCITSAAYNAINYLLATNTQSGIHSVDITNLQSPLTTLQINEELGGSKGGSPYWMERVGSIGYVANGVAGISIINLEILGDFNVINYINNGPKNGSISTSLVAFGIAVFGDNDQHILVPNAGQSAVAGYLILSKEQTNPTSTIPSISTTNDPISTTAVVSTSSTSTTKAATSITTIIADTNQATMTSQPSSNPIRYPTINPISTTTIAKTENVNMKYQREMDELTQLYQYVAGGFIGGFLLIVFLSSIDAKCLRINDYFKIGAILSMMLQTIDMMSDCFFAVEVSIQNKMHKESDDMIYYKLIFYGSIIFIIFPAVISLFQLYFYANKHWLDNDYVRSWISKYSTILLLLSVITGSSFAAVSLLNSYIFQISLFDMGLTEKKLKGFNTRRIYSIVLVENVPQLALQSYFLYLQGVADNPITLSSIAFSVISIIISIMSMTMQKRINNTQRYIIISMNITGDCVEDNSSKCRTMRNKLKRKLAVIIGVDHNTIEIIKPTYISNGFAMHIHIYANNNNQRNKTAVDYEKIFDTANQNGRLVKIFQSNWNLSGTPLITNIKSDIIESKTEKNINKKQLKIQMETPASSQYESVQIEIPTINTTNQSETQ